MSEVSQDKPEIDEGNQMSEKRKETTRASPDEVLPIEASPAQRRWNEDRGAEIAYVAEWLRLPRSSKLYIYEFDFRNDVLLKDDPVLMVKAIRDGSPVIAFVYSPSLLAGLSQLSGLFRSGKLKWREDNFPSRKVVKYLEERQDN